MSNWKLINIKNEKLYVGIAHMAPYCETINYSIVYNTKFHTPAWAYEARCRKCDLEIPRKMINKAYERQRWINKLMELQGL